MRFDRSAQWGCFANHRIVSASADRRRLAGPFIGRHARNTRKLYHSGVRSEEETPMKCALIVCLAFLLFVAMALAQNSATETQPKTPTTASPGAGAQLFNVDAAV